MCRSTRLGLFAGGLLLLAACTTPPPTPTPVDESRLRDGNMPKIIVTVEMRTNVEEESALPTEENAAPLTLTEESEIVLLPSPQVTPTRYVGVFIGEPTSVGPEGVSTIPPTIAPLPLPGQPVNPVGVPVSPIITEGDCSIPVAEVFANAYASNPSLQGFGCPREPGFSLSLVIQRFERGAMLWRDTRQIIVLSSDRTFWRVPDTWNEGLPADDPAFAPPEGRFQPVRGFGLAWRSNETFRNALGWALEPEVPLSSYWQEFEGGTLLLGDGGLIFAVPAGSSGQYTGGIAP